MTAAWGTWRGVFATPVRRERELEQHRVCIRAVGEVPHKRHRGTSDAL